jgi:hypothetical protein
MKGEALLDVISLRTLSTGFESMRQAAWKLPASLFSATRREQCFTRLQAAAKGMGR